ncbi:hypothetical protein B2J88_08660 [Rhodococcus sp. SRB_17]|nr:hypothetical protein [Rhodococcus sp. SRB_17]
MTRAPITAVVGGVVLAASVMFGTAVGPAAAAETPAELLTRVCARYVPNPDPVTYTDCSNRTLSTVVLTGMDLRYAKLTKTDMTGAILTGAKLSNADLTEARLDSTSLFDANLTGAKLTGATLTGANLTAANLTGADLSGAILTNANLTGADLTGSSLIPGDVTVPATPGVGTAVAWTAPTLPTGVDFSTCSLASGTLFPAGTTAVTCTAGNTMGSGSGAFTVNVTPYTVAPAFVDPPLQQLPAVVGTAFTPVTFTATGTPEPITIIVTDKTQLPPGMTFENDLVTGAPTLAGTPTTTGTYTFTVIATNGTAPDATLQVTVVVTAPPATGSLGSLGSIFGS